MASAFQNTWQIALDIEKELLKSLAEKEPTFTEISHYLSELRAACQNAIIQDLEAAHSLDVEGRLWDAHLKINNRFRKLLSRFREQNGKKKKPVERRKLEKHYLEFIKTSQRFYRGYIQQLSSHIGGIPELEKVARKFNFDNLSVEEPTQSSGDLRSLILLSCHATLIRLGDLSRYRETELVGKDRNWGPAIGYYNLATVIYPASGTSHNQLAVIALADGNHLRATYHLYRALAAQEPHPSAKGNLEIEFRKVRNLWTKRELIRPEDAGIPGRALAPWFVYLHAQCYKGTDFPEHDELESEVLNQLAVDLKERSLEGTLQKFCLVNIAAEEFSRTRSNEESVSNARLFFQRINVKTFFTLLQILLAEVERFAVEESNNRDGTNGPDKITAVARRVLPALRNYSSWLLTVNHLLVAVAHKEEKDNPLSVQITEFWKIYANTLTLLASTFDVVLLPEIDYLLEEDEETLCFVPLNKGTTSRRYMDTNGFQKPRMNDPGVERNHPNMEMLYRIREFVIDGLDLVVSNKIPIALVDDGDKKTFIYKEEGLPSQFFASPAGHQHTLSSASIGREDIQQVAQDPSYITDSRSVFGGSQSASMSASMHRIVEGVERLVESDTYENTPALPEHLTFPRSNQQPTSSHIFNPSTDAIFREESIPARQNPIAPPGFCHPMANAAALARAPSSQSYAPRPSLPGIPSIWNTSLSAEVGDATSPRTPPGLGQHPVQHSGPLMPGSISSPPNHLSQDSAVNELMLRQSLMHQSQLQSSLSGPSSISTWIPPSNPTPHHRLSGLGWDSRGPLDAVNPPSTIGIPGQPPSSDFGSSSWANDAFPASTLSPGAGYPSSGFGGSRRAATHYGAIGQTPPCPQGG